MEEKNNKKVDIEILNTKGQLIYNILAIAGILLTIVFFLYPKVFGENDGIQTTYITIKSPQLPSKGKNLFNDVKRDSVAMQKLSKYLDGGIPPHFYKFHDPQENQFLTIDEKLQFKLISENISGIKSILCEDSGSSDYRYSNIYFIQTWYKYLSEITIYNTRKEKIKNLEITVGDGYYSRLIDEEFSGIYVNPESDSMIEFSNSSPIIIDELNPNELYSITLWSETLIGGLYKLTLNYEGGSEEINAPILIETSSTFDTVMTLLVVNNKFVQLLLYITSPIGFYYLFRYIRKIYRSLIKTIFVK